MIGAAVLWMSLAVAQEPAHWALALAHRVEVRDRGLPVVDRVVLVPDAATYLDELSQWSPRGVWPVLIEDNHLAPMFIRRFRPAQVVRRAAVEGQPPVTAARLEAAVTRAWGGDPGAPASGTPRDAFVRAGHTPAGVVITSVDDPAWTAAVALAAGRGEPLAFLKAKAFGRPNQQLAADRFADLARAIDDLVAAAGYPWADPGDAIEAITLCMAVAGRADVAPGSPAAAGPGAGANDGPRAITDLLGRRADGRRYAFAGWIFGDERRCAYAAMCSLFLDRRRVELYNTYREPQVNEIFGMDQAAALLAAQGYEVVTIEAEHATKAAWLAALPGGLDTDVLVMNSSGNSMNFHLADDRAYCGDVPVLDVPLALHFTHSFSMKSPDNPGTIGGRWLARGAYAVVGSVDEPTLAGFVPPRILAERCAASVPFLIAARRWDDSPPWKINTFGDPLMTCPPPQRPPPLRLAPGPVGARAVDLNEHVKTLMRRADAEPGPEALAEAARTLDLLGADSVAIQMWRLARRRDMAGAAAAGALGPLFRARLSDEFVTAWQALPARGEAADDMLWHLLTPRLASAGTDTLILLQSVIRTSQGFEDVSRLAPYLTAAFGPAHTRALVQRQLDRTTSPPQRRVLRKLLRNP